MKTVTVSEVGANQEVRVGPASMTINSEALRVLRRVREKLRGRDRDLDGAGTQILTVPNQVYCYLHFHESFKLENDHQICIPN